METAGRAARGCARYLLSCTICNITTSRNKQLSGLEPSIVVVVGETATDSLWFP
jgi:hypothetical protein